MLDQIPALAEAASMASSTVTVFSQSFDPGVTPQSDAPFLPALRTVAGWGMVLGLVFLVIVVIVGGVLIGTGKIANTPGNQSKGFLVVLFGLIGSAVVASASAIVFFGTTIMLMNEVGGTTPVEQQQQQQAPQGQ